MRKWMLCGLLVLTALGAGCSDENDPAKPAPEGYPLADSPDQLMENFLNAHEDRDLAEYVLCLDDGFRFDLQQATVDAFQLPAAFFTYAQEVAISEQMFSGGTPGTVVGPITDINFAVLSRIEDQWSDVGGGLREATFEVILAYTRSTTEGDNQVAIRGRITVRVMSEQVADGGQTRTRFRLDSIVDETAAVKGVDDQLWGSLKAEYLPELVID
ncbi:MAG: hypothetical protein GY838_08395 [bacterium]|nr:hypothetical protein [bacterium]